MSRTTPNHIESRERRELFSCAVARPIDGTLRITCDGASDRAFIADNGAGVIQGYINGVSFGTIREVRDVHIETMGGNDLVRYRVHGDMPWGIPGRSVSADLGAGDDEFVFLATDDIDVAGGARFDVRAFGNSGNDELRAFYTGELDGHLGVVMTGGDGNDFLFTLANFDYGSGGRFWARCYGEAGVDTVDIPATDDRFFNYQVVIDVLAVA